MLASSPSLDGDGGTSNVGAAVGSGAVGTSVGSGASGGTPDG